MTVLAERRILIASASVERPPLRLAAPVLQISPYGPIPLPTIGSFPSSRF